MYNRLKKTKSFKVVMRDIASRFTPEYVSSLRNNDGLWQMSIIDLQHNLRDARMELADVLEFLASDMKKRKSKL